ncbi:hypothetical protein [Teichococcus rhizosphaerae]|uniref:hypothetical protein n=1 Tax=Teichococcus rhizosphaerae TaxID=1335062 RepID=UPI001FEB58D5|nr:hypothetical protein [Pseudoroseomonas rhizosphaerae]
MNTRPVAGTSTGPRTGPDATMAVQGAPSLRGRLSWGAVLAGVVIALAVSAMLNTLGVAIGANLVDAAERATPDAASMGIGGGIWLLASHLIGLGLGAYAAARLSGTADGTDGSLHGLSVWATGTLFSAYLLGSVVSSAAGTAATGVSNMLGGLAQGAGNVTAMVGGEAAARTDTGTLQSVSQGVIDRAREALAATNAAPDAMNSDQRKAEIGRLVGRRVTDGQLPQPEQERLAALVAAEAGISPDEARARIQQTEQEAQQALQRAEEEARQAADTAATAAATAAYWTFAALLLGAIVAVLGARAGTRAVLARTTSYH